MKAGKETGYWGSLIAEIRQSLKMNQEDFAEAVYSNQATVSRWEKGLVIPSYDKQRKIEQLAEAANIISLGGIVEVIRNSPHRILLVDKNGFVIAASLTSEWQDNKSVKDQLTNASLSEFMRLSKVMSESNFWNSGGGERLDSFFYDGSRTWKSVVTSLVIRGTAFAVVQQVVE